MLKPQTKIIPPVPREFAVEFAKGGWRRVERLYGARTDVILKWIDMCGGRDHIDAIRKSLRAAVKPKPGKG